jgi:CHAT domain-containing protein
MNVISSYAPSIKTLKFSMSQSTEGLHLDGRKGLLFVGMPTTPGGSGPLPGVLEEEAVVKKACGEKCGFEARNHPNADEVLEEMRKSKLVHFACHGSSDAKAPSDSHLLLQKHNEIGLAVDRLSVERLSKVRGKDRSFLAFLSACSTAEVKATSELADEAIHLASIFEVAGFAHTIGALWSASDKACVQVAGEFYRQLFEDGEGGLSNDTVAKALHSAVRKVKLTDGRPEIWAPFVHYRA